MLLPFWETIGLTQKEANLYELLLRLGEVPAQDIIRESKLKRATVYKSLYALEKKGLVTKKDIKKIIHFAPSSPTKLLEVAETQFGSLERAKVDLQAMLPALISTYTLSVEKPVIRTFEGIEGIKKAHLEVLSEKKEIAAYVRINEEIDRDLADFWPRYYTIRRKDKIFARVITPNTKGAKLYHKNDKRQLRESRLLPKEQFLINLEKDIVGNKVVFFAITEDKQLIATLIENKTIADAERAIFELAWKEAEYYNNKLAKS